MGVWIPVLLAIQLCQVVTAMLTFRFSIFDRRSAHIHRMLHEHKLLSTQFCINLFQLNLVLHYCIFQRPYQSLDFCISDRHSPLIHHTLLTPIQHCKSEERITDTWSKSESAQWTFSLLSNKVSGGDTAVVPPIEWLWFGLLAGGHKVIVPFLKIEIVPVAFPAVIIRPVVCDPQLLVEFYRQSLRVGECGHVFVALSSAGCIFGIS